MAAPNGEMDPWADAIVSTRFRFVQVSSFYDQLADVPDSLLAELPDNPLGAWIAAKQSRVWALPQSADQVGIMAAAVPSFAVAVDRVSAAPTIGPGATAGPELRTDPNGSAWLVRQSDTAEATNRFRQVLRDPNTYRP
jgi:hypothetical protein